MSSTRQQATQKPFCAAPFGALAVGCTENVPALSLYSLLNQSTPVGVTSQQLQLEHVAFQSRPGDFELSVDPATMGTRVQIRRTGVYEITINSTLQVQSTTPTDIDVSIGVVPRINGVNVQAGIAGRQVAMSVAVTTSNVQSTTFVTALTAGDVITLFLVSSSSVDGSAVSVTLPDVDSPTATVQSCSIALSLAQLS
jgi:hypothetical protein